jgi:hypothetical protein
MNKFLYLVVMLSAFIFSGCNEKDSREPVNDGSLKIVSLTATKDTIHAWDTTILLVTSNKIAELIEWEANHGTLLGGGDSIIYSAGNCCLGTNTIKCTISGGGATDTASIRIHVLPYVIPQ